MFHHRSKLLLGLLAACAIASITWQSVRYQQRAALRAAALKTDVYEVRVESMLPPWVSRAAASLDSRLPQSWRLNMDDWKLFDRTKSVFCIIDKSTVPIEHLAAFNDAEVVTIQTLGPQPRLLHQLTGYWRLKQLVLEGAAFGPDDFRALCDIPSNFTLTLDWRAATAANLRALRNARGLTGLKLNAGSFDCANLRGFQHLRRLEVDNPYGGSTHLTNLPELATLNLTELDLGAHEVRASDMQALARLPLVEFRFGSDILRRDGRRSLAKITSLKSLHLYGHRDFGLVEALAPLQLDSLVIPGFELRSETIDRLGQMPTLKVLNIAFTPLSDAQLDSLANLPLRELTFLGRKDDKQTFASLSRMHLLERLTIYDAQDERAVLRSIKNHAKLNFIHLGTTQLHLDDAETLATCPQMKTVCVTEKNEDFANRLLALRPDITVIENRYPIHGPIQEFSIETD